MDAAVTTREYAITFGALVFAEALALGCGVIGLTWPIEYRPVALAMGGAALVPIAAVLARSVSRLGVPPTDAAGHRERHRAGTDHRRDPDGRWAARRARWRPCPSGHGHCVHPRPGDAYWTATEPIVVDDGPLQYVDPGGWCCECPARWRWAPIPSPACRACDPERSDADQLRRHRGAGVVRAVEDGVG